MRDGELKHQREMLREAFAAGWQAALAMNITNPRVLAVIERCFDLWLKEAADEVDVFGLSFRGRPDLPSPDWEAVTAASASGFPEQPPRGRARIDTHASTEHASGGPERLTG
ncbi:MAG TPA: hypothetical protein VF049_07895 [Nocardioidaceae bacterium]